MDITIGIPRRLGYLPLVVDVLRRTGIIEIIDRALPKDPRSKVSTSDCVAVFMCAIYSGHHDLWRMSDRLGQFDMATIMRNPSFDLSAFTEERLAKCLDHLWAKNPDMLMTSLAIQAISAFRINTDFLHFDTTSLLFFGSQDDGDIGSLHDGTQPFPAPPLITFGHSKDHRPDLLQIMFGTLVSSDGGVPLFGRALDGNASDSASAALFFQRIRSIVKHPKEVCCVADAKGWCGRVLQLVQHENLRLLSRLPRSHSLHKFLMDKPWKNPKRIARFTSGGKPMEDYYEIIGNDVEEILDYRPELPTTSPDAKAKPDKIHIEVPSRAVRVFSSALLRRKQATLKRTTEREETQAKRCMAQWHAIPYACRADAENAAAIQQADSDFVTLDIIPVIRAVRGPFKRGRGRPRKRPLPEIDGNHYRIDYEAKPVSETVRTQRLTQQSTFILIRTRTKGWSISDEEMIERYKGQFHNEHGFAWLKSGPSHKGLNPIFLETPERIAALCFLYVVGLMVWTLVQRTVRKNLKEWKLGLPYHRNKPSDNITTRFYFELFPSIQTVPYSTPDGKAHVQLVGITPIIELACKALGTDVGVFQPNGAEK